MCTLCDKVVQLYCPHGLLQKGTSQKTDKRHQGVTNVSCKRITAVLLSAIVAFSVCVPAFGAEDAQTLNTGVPVNEEEPASPESADRSEEPALLEYADETEESASLENAGGTEEPDSADLLEEPNAAEEQPDEEQPAWT